MTHKLTSIGTHLSTTFVVEGLLEPCVRLSDGTWFRRTKSELTTELEEAYQAHLQEGKPKEGIPNPTEFDPRGVPGPAGEVKGDVLPPAKRESLPSNEEAKEKRETFGAVPDPWTPPTIEERIAVLEASINQLIEQGKQKPEKRLLPPNPRFAGPGMIDMIMKLADKIPDAMIELDDPEFGAEETGAVGTCGGQTCGDQGPGLGVGAAAFGGVSGALFPGNHSVAAGYTAPPKSLKEMMDRLHRPSMNIPSTTTTVTPLELVNMILEGKIPSNSRFVIG